MAWIDATCRSSSTAQHSSFLLRGKRFTWGFPGVQDRGKGMYPLKMQQFESPDKRSSTHTSYNHTTGLRCKTLHMATDVLRWSPSCAFKAFCYALDFYSI